MAAVEGVKGLMNNILKSVATLMLLAFSGLVAADLSTNPLVPKAEAAFARDYLQKLHERSFDHVKAYLDPALTAQVPDQKLEDIAQHFPSGKVVSTELVGSQTNVVNSVWHGNFSFEYQFEGGWAVANVVLKRTGEQLSVLGFNVYRTDASQREINKFVLQGKSAWHYTILAQAVTVPVFIIATLIVCLRTPIPRRKWLWVLFILGGIGSISINWTTGAWEFQLLHYLLFGGAALAASEHAPWVITAGFPLGAIVFWLKRRKFIALSIVQPAAPEENVVKA